MKKLAIAASIYCVTLVGCMNTPPLRTDPFSNLEGSPAAAPLKNISIALVLSDNTKKSIEYARALPGGATAFDYTRVFGNIADVFTGTFRRAVKVQAALAGQRYASTSDTLRFRSARKR